MDNSEVMTTYLTKLKKCRTCLRDTVQPIDQEVRTTLANCFERSTENTFRYLNFVCEQCRDFLNKCREFSELCGRAKSNMKEFSKTGTWPGDLAIPSWLTTPAPKRQPLQEDATPVKKVRDGTQQKSKIGQISVRPYASLMGQSSIPSSVMQAQYSAEHMIQTQHSQDHSMIQPTYPEFEPSAVGQPGMQHSTVQAVSLEPRSEPPAVARHLQTIGQTKPTPWPQCPVCLLLFVSEEYIKYHIRKHCYWKQLKAYRGMFGPPEKGIEHLKEPNRMWCKFCQTNFADEPALDEHLNQHMKAHVIYSCDFCVLLFVDQNSKQRHLDSDHREDVRQMLKLNPNLGKENDVA